MRLLFCKDNGEYGLTNDLDVDNRITRYAILSHTWFADKDEPTFEDLTNGTGKEKPGYEKIRFCGKQAGQDGLRYFWVDTCCINKETDAELSQAINSMFRWYHNATRCYVYLSDVPRSPFDTNDKLNIQSWDSDFWKSRWFTRGWTLQELLAPHSVEFFSKEGKRLGDKNSLEQQIQEITGIPALALQGAPLSQLGVDKPFLWMDHRQTKLDEDKVYSLLGIFDVAMPLSYGEGWTNAFQRLREVIDKRQTCVKDLRLTDPRDDKKRIEETKGGLLEDSYHWILKNPDFQRWRNDQQNRLLWIKGDPGKGKTMLLCGIINELGKLTAKTALLSYFFCQATDSGINNATAVLRGLIYILVGQQPSLISHILKKYDHAGKSLFEDANSWVALAEIFTNILQDLSLNSTYLIVDGLDECVTGLPKLLDLIVQTSSVSFYVKWIVSSRNWPGIGERLVNTGHNLSLELNAESVSAAVSIFIRHKVLELAQRKKYNNKIRDAVLDHLSLNANGTFLWVALVCQDLEKIPKLAILARLNDFPPGLDALYEQMMKQIRNSDYTDLCNRIIALITIVYRPITLTELTSLIDEDMSDDVESLQEIIGFCGSFLTVLKDAIYFVHQSAKDYLLANAFNEIFPSGKEGTHHDIFSRSLEVMSRTLRRDLYSLSALGFSIDQLRQPNPDPLAAARYSCVYWVDHLHDCEPTRNATNDIQNGGSVDKFLRRSYLYWLEALSLCKSMSDGVFSMAKLEALIQVILESVKICIAYTNITQGRLDTSVLLELVRDARRFIMYYKWAIEKSPLQVYTSALVFSPTRSLIRGLFREEEPEWITIKPAVEDNWNACLQTLEGHSSGVCSVAFSPDSTRLVSASIDGTVKI